MSVAPTGAGTKTPKGKGAKTMERQELIKKLERIKDLIAWNACKDLTDYAREHAIIDIEDAIEQIRENEE